LARPVVTPLVAYSAAFVVGRLNSLASTCLEGQGYAEEIPDAEEAQRWTEDRRY